MKDKAVKRSKGIATKAPDQDHPAGQRRAVDPGTKTAPPSVGSPVTGTIPEQIDHALLKRILDAIDLPVFVKDTYGKYMGGNRAFYTLLGIEPHRLAGKSVFDVAPPHLAETYHRMDRELLEHGGTQVYEAVVRASDGTERNVVFHKSLFSDAQGSTAGIVGVILDVTEHKKAGEALRQSEEKFRTLFETVTDLLYYHDLEGNYVPSECNASFHKHLSSVTGAPKAPVNVRDLMPEKYRDRFDDYMKDLLGKGRDSGIIAVQNKDGNRLYFEYNNYLVTKDGVPVGVRGFARDVTDAVRARQALARSEEKFRSIIETMEDGYLECDLAGRITFVNPALSRILGTAENRIKGKTYHEVLDTTSAKALYAAMEEVFATGTPSRLLTMDIIRPDRTAVATESTISLIIDRSGNRVGFRAVVRDVTERARLERTLREHNAALEASRRDLERSHADLAKAYAELKQAQAQIIHSEKLATLGQLAAGVAHEINNPMGFIASNLNTLGKYMDRITGYLAEVESIMESLPREVASRLAQRKKDLKLDAVLEDVANLITESLEGADRVRRIVLDLKSFSHQDAPEIATADINKCLESTITIVWNELKYKAALHKNFSDLPPVRCYPQQLNQVFMNLLVNAAHAIEDKGDITVTSTHADGWIEVSVTDTGCGIPKENLPKIFEPFFTTKEKGKGTGLGLAIAADIVRRHGGEITVESEPGKGSTFTVRIPVSGVEP